MMYIFVVHSPLKQFLKIFAFHYDLCTVCVDYVLSITDIVTKCYSCSGPNT